MDAFLTIRAMQISPDATPTPTLHLDTIICLADGSPGTGEELIVPLPLTVDAYRQTAIDAAIDYWGLTYTIIGAIDGQGNEITHS